MEDFGLSVGPDGELTIVDSVSANEQSDSRMAPTTRLTCNAVS